MTRDVRERKDKEEGVIRIPERILLVKCSPQGIQRLFNPLLLCLYFIFLSFSLSTVGRDWKPKEHNSLGICSSLLLCQEFVLHSASPLFECVLSIETPPGVREGGGLYEVRSHYKALVTSVSKSIENCTSPYL